MLTTAGSEEDAPLYALMDGQGSCLTDAEYSWLTYYPEDDVVIGQLSDGTQRALSTGGERLLDCDYSLIVPNGQGGWLTAETEKFSYGERWGALTLIAALLLGCDGRLRLFELLGAVVGFCLYWAGFAPLLRCAVLGAVRMLRRIFVKISSNRLIKVIFR